MSTGRCSRTQFRIQRMSCVPGEDVPEVVDYDPHIVENISAISLPRDIPVWEISIKVTFYVIAFLIAVIGNIVVILIIVLNKRMKSTTNVFLLNLAVSDLMVGCFCMWIHLGNSITKEWPFGVYVCKVNTFMQGNKMFCHIMLFYSFNCR